MALREPAQEAQPTNETLSQRRKNPEETEEGRSLPRKMPASTGSALSTPGPRPGKQQAGPDKTSERHRENSHKETERRKWGHAFTLPNKKDFRPVTAKASVKWAGRIGTFSAWNLPKLLYLHTHIPGGSGTAAPPGGGHKPRSRNGSPTQPRERGPTPPPASVTVVGPAHLDPL